jgi:putative peptide zinc metalloprotease protein
LHAMPQAVTPLSSLIGAAAPAPQPLPSLPALREDLALFESSPNTDGSPAWVVQDPVRNKFYRIGWLEFELMIRWEPDALEVLKNLFVETTLRPSLEDAFAFAHFLRSQNLIRLETAQDLHIARKAPGKPTMSNWHWWLHNYLFFRVPLMRPEKVLQRITPALSFLASPFVLSLLGLVSLMGVYFASRQSELFLQTFVDSFTLSGLISFGLALALAKTLHELGHAVVATHYGVRVAHAGVAFLVLWPMLYTDTGESWRLHNNRQRLAIASAGMAVELALAGLSLLGWALAPPGALRSAFFYLASTSLLMTLALNASPFMRFDGYYVMSDALDMPNLHERAGAIAKTSLRRTLLGFKDVWPEFFAPAKHRMLLAFAFSTWIYRLFVFIGIAVAVYFMFFKLLGIFLFLVEVIWFIIRPFYAEFKVWHQRRADIQAGRASVWLLVLLALVVAVAFPWSHDIHAVAHLQAEHRTIYSPLAGRVAQIQATGMVSEGMPLVTLDNPKLRSDVQRAKINARATRAAQVNADLGTEQGRENISRLGITVEQYMAEDKAAGQELERMRLTADFAARWTDIDSNVVVGSWLRPQDPIGTLVEESSWLVEAWVEESLVQYLSVGTVGKFYAANGLQEPLAVKLLEVDSVRAASLPHAGLSTDHGGSIPTTTDGKTLMPRETLYRVRFEVLGKPEHMRWTRGRVAFEGKAHSKVWMGLRYAAAVFVRESGF